MPIRWLRLRRFLWRIVGIISTLIILAIAPLYARSYFVGDQTGRNWYVIRNHDQAPIRPLIELNHGETFAGSNRGILTVAWLKSYECDSFRGVNPSPLKVTWTWKVVPTEKSAVNWAGFDWQYRHVQKADVRPPWVNRSALAVSVPDWFLLLAAASILALSLWRLRRLRQRERIALGLCVHCAYDLRASQDRCPECGRPFAPHPPSP